MGSFVSSDTNETHRRSTGRLRVPVYSKSKEKQLSEDFNAFLSSEKFQISVVCFIMVNSLLMGLETFDFVTENDKVQGIFNVIDRSFLAVFTIELVLHMLNEGANMIHDNWLMFDFTVIILSWLCTTVKVIRALRIVRILHLVPFLRSLRIIVTALYRVLPKVMAIGSLLCLVMYVYAVMFTELFKHLYSEGKTDLDYFSSLPMTCFTLFQIITIENWSSIARQVMVFYPWAWFPFICYVMTTRYMLINIIVAVVCNAVNEIKKAEVEDELASRTMARRKEIEEMKEEVNAIRFIVLKLSHSENVGESDSTEERGNLVREYDDDVSIMRPPKLNRLI